MPPARSKKQEEDLKAQLETHEGKVEELEQVAETGKAEVAALKTEQGDLAKSIEELGKQKATASESLKAKNLTIEAAESKLSTVVQRIAEKDAELGVKTQKAAELTQDLENLSHDRSFYTDDMKGVAEQTYQDSRLFAGLLALCIVVALGLGVWLMIGATELFRSYLDHPKDYEVWNLVLSRLPFVTFAGMVYGVIGWVSRKLVIELIAVKRQLRKLKAVVVVARDITDSALHDSGFSEEDRIAARLAVRMALAREDLSRVFDNGVPAQRSPAQVTQADVKKSAMLLTPRAKPEVVKAANDQ